MIIRFFITFILFLPCGSAAQYDVDSLKSIIANPTIHDTTRLANIALILDNLFEYEASVRYTDMMGKISQKNLSKKNLNPELKRKYTMYLAAYYNNVSIQLADNGDLKALGHLNKSIQLYKSLGADEEYYSSLVSKGILLSRRKQYREAIDCYYKALKYFERDVKEHADGISYVYSNLGVLYGEQYQHKEAINFLKKAIHYIDIKGYRRTVEDDLQKSAMFFNIGAFYFTLKNYDEAAKNLSAAYTLAEINNYNTFMSRSLSKLAEIDMLDNRLDEAEKKLIKAMDLADNDMSMSIAKVRLGELYLHKNEYNKAKQFLNAGLEVSRKIRFNDLQQEAYKLLYELGKQTGDYKNALEMVERYHQMEDSTKIEDNKNELRRQNIKYDYEKKELKLKLEAQQRHAAKNNILIGLSAAILLLLLGSYFLYRNYKQKQAIANFEKRELGQKLFLSQMNPHFIFNSIDNIQGLIHESRDAEALNYLSKFSKLTRQILENSSENYITLAEELLMIENYIGIQQLLYGDFDFAMHIDERLEPEKTLLPPMLTQPFIENSIKHGLRGKNGGGMIDISFLLRENKLIFVVADNGVGFSDEVKTSSNKSLAIKITRERLQHFSKTPLEVHSKNLKSADGKIIGAKVFFEIPYLYEK